MTEQELSPAKEARISPERERLEAALRQKYPNDALERLVQSNYDYYSTHGDYLPELAQLLLIERDQLEQAEQRAELAERQLKAVDKALPPWETERAEGAFAVGRVQTILNLVADRAAQSKESEDSRA